MQQKEGRGESGIKHITLSLIANKENEVLLHLLWYIPSIIEHHRLIIAVRRIRHFKIQVYPIFNAIMLNFFLDIFTLSAFFSKSFYIISFPYNIIIYTRCVVFFSTHRMDFACFSFPEKKSIHLLCIIIMRDFDIIGKMV